MIRRLPESALIAEERGWRDFHLTMLALSLNRIERIMKDLSTLTVQMPQLEMPQLAVLNVSKVKDELQKAAAALVESESSYGIDSSPNLRDLAAGVVGKYGRPTLER